MKLKFSILFIFLNICLLKSNAQDLSDEKSIAGIKSFKFINADKKHRSYSLILNDNSFLNVKFNEVQDGEYNATYTFIITPLELYFKDTKEFNQKYINDNILQLCKIINLNNTQIETIKLAIFKTPLNIGKPTLFNLGFKSYDESQLIFSNNGLTITCTFFFRRLL